MTDPESARSLRRRCPKQLLDRLRQECSESAQTLRRALLSDCRVLVVMGGYPGEAVRRDYYDRASELGVELVLLDSPKHMPLSSDLIRDGVMALGLALDLDDSSSWGRVLEAVRKVGPFHGVTTFIEFGVPLAAWLAGRLGLPGNPFEAVILARDKEKLRRRARELGLPTPGFFRIRGEDDIAEATRSVTFPAILKPVSGLTSVEVHYLETADDLLPNYRATMSRMDEGASGNPDLLAMISRAGRDMILEEFLDGREFDIDFLLSEGQCVYAAVTDNITHTDWPCVLVEANMPSDLTPRETRSLVDRTVGWTQSLGFREGVFHVEVKTRKSGDPVLLEVNARLGGASQYQLNRNVWGIDLVEEHLLNCVGIPNRPLVSQAPKKAYAARYLLAPYSGRITRDGFLDFIRNSPQAANLLVCEAWTRTGETVRGPESGPPDWIGEVTVGAESLEEAKSGVDHLIHQITFQSFLDRQ